MDDEEILCDYCEAAKVQLVCQDCFQGMWCSEKCHLADAADHDEYFCYHPDDLSDECVLEEMEHVTHDPQEAREMMKEMIGDDLIEAFGRSSASRQNRRRRKALRREKRRVRRQRKRMIRKKKGAKRKRKRKARQQKKEDKAERDIPGEERKLAIERKKLHEATRQYEKELGRGERAEQERLLRRDGIERVRPDEPLPDEFYYEAETAAAQIASFIL